MAPETLAFPELGLERTNLPVYVKQPALQLHPPLFTLGFSLPVNSTTSILDLFWRDRSDFS